MSLWSGNYYHWLIDCLPRLATLQAADLAHLPLVVPRRLTRFQQESLAALGVGEARLTPFLDDDDALLPDSLVWASAPAPVNYPTPFVVDWLRRHLRDDASRTPAVRRHEGRRLLLSRGDARRTITNECELQRALEPMGFEVLAPEELDLAGQAAMFAEASAIVAPHGAGLTNIVFSDPLPILELFPPDRVTWHYYTLSRAAGHDYWYALGKAATHPRRMARGDFSVDVTLVLRTVEAMLGTQSKTRRPRDIRSP